MQLAFFLVFIIVFLIFTLGSAILMYHFINFRFSKRQHGFILILLVAGAIFFTFVEFTLFFSMDWEELTSFVTDAVDIKVNETIKIPF